MLEIDKIALINYRIQRSLESSEDARIAIENSRQFNAQNRIYYSMFYIVSALALKNDFSTSKHSQLLGWFNKNYIFTKIIDIKFGKFYKIAYENRQLGDYDDFVEFSDEDILENYNNSCEFIKEVKNIINNE